MREPELPQPAARPRRRRPGASRARARRRSGRGSPRRRGQASGRSDRCAKPVGRVTGRSEYRAGPGRTSRRSLTTASMPPPSARRSSASPPSASRAAARSRGPGRSPASRVTAPEPVERPLALLRGQPGAVGRRRAPPTQPSPRQPTTRDRVGEHGERVRDQVVDASARAGPAVLRTRSAAHSRRRDPALRLRRAGRRAPRRRPPPRLPSAPASARASESSASTSRPSRSTSARRGPGGRCESEVLEPEPQRRQRRSQLVRGVGDERLLRVEELLELRSRLVELVREPRAPPAGPLLGRARVEIARRRSRAAASSHAAQRPRRPRARARGRPARRRRARSPRSRRASASSAERAGRPRRSGT